MATEVTHIVDPGEGAGHDYHSLSLWEAGEQGDLTGVRDEIAIAKCRATGGTADTTRVTIDGWTTSATQYIKIWTDPAESYRHAGKWDDTKYRLNFGDIPLNEVGIHVAEDFSYISGIQFTGNTAATSGTRKIVHLAPPNSGGAAYFFKNIVKMTFSTASATGACYGIWTTDSDPDYYIYNNIIYDCYRLGDSHVGIRVENNPTYAYLENNTVYNCNIGIVGQNADRVIAKNNLIVACGTPASGTFAAGTDYNATDASSLGYSVTGSGNTHDVLDATAVFVNAAGDDFHLATGDSAIGAGVNLYNDATPFQDDIDGDDRGGAAASWDIGADEYVAAITDLSIHASECVGSDGHLA